MLSKFHKPFAIGGLLAALVISCQATTFQNTLAWSRYYPCSNSKLAVDAAGNTYVVYTAPASGSMVTVSFSKLSPSGNVLASHTLLTLPVEGVGIRGVYLSSPASPTPYLYLALDKSVQMT